MCVEVMVVMGKGRYRGRQGMDHSWETRDHCLMTVSPSSFLVSALGPRQQTFRSSGFWLLLLNACNKAFLISNVITVERANLAYITKTWLAQKGGSWSFWRYAQLGFGCGISWNSIGVCVRGGREGGFWPLKPFMALDCLSLITSAHPIKSDRESMLRVASQGTMFDGY